MLKNLERNQAEKLRSRFREHPLLLTCQQAFRHYMASMDSFDFTSEDLFVEAAIAIDEILESPTDALQYLEDLWDNLKIKLKSGTQPVPPQDDLNIVCSVLFYVIAATMSLHWREYYAKEVVGLLRQKVEKERMLTDESEQNDIIENLCKHSEGLEAWINGYEDCGEWLSDEIETCLQRKEPESLEDVREIDIEKLKKHFKIDFTRKGGGFETLIDILKIYHITKDFAIIANQIYNSPKFHREDFNTFLSWYRSFCEIVGCKCCEDYKPSKLKPTKEQEASFYFLK